MSRDLLARILVSALLIGAGLVSDAYSDSYRTPGLLYMQVFGWTAFGLLNVIVSVPGTLWLRVASIGVSFVALLLPMRGIVPALFIWLAWPPAFMIAASLGRKSRSKVEETELDATTMWARGALGALIAAVAVATFAYRWFVLHNLHQTAALFVGIPAIMAILVVVAVSPRSAVGVACKAVTVGLLVSFVFLGEGMLCVAMTAPLFYAIAVVIAFGMKLARRDEKPPVLRSFMILLMILPMSLEGVTGFTTISREESVSQTKIIRIPAAAVERALIETPRFERVRPLYLRMGFPIPVATLIDKNTDHVRWTVRFRGGETRIDGMEPRAGDLVLELEEMRPGFARWRTVSDSSHMTHFLDWSGAIVQWEAIDAETTKVTWTLEYRRGLDPAWYFGPMERYAVGLAAGYLIDSVATP